MPGYQNQPSSHKEQVRSTLDTLAREGAQRMLINALEQEVEEFLGRARYARAEGEGRGYRNGAGNPRKIALGCGTVELRAPRVRDTREPFRSQMPSERCCRSCTCRGWRRGTSSRRYGRCWETPRR